MKEATVGSVEQSDTERQVETHNPEFSVTGHKRTKHETDLNGDPVQMKHNDSSQRQTETSDAEDRRITVDDKERNAAHNDDCPDAGPARPPGGDRVDERLCLGIGRDSEFRPHGE